MSKTLLGIDMSHLLPHLPNVTVTFSKQKWLGVICFQKFILTLIALVQCSCFQISFLFLFQYFFSFWSLVESGWAPFLFFFFFFDPGSMFERHTMGLWIHLNLLDSNIIQTNNSNKIVLFVFLVLYIFFFSYQVYKSTPFIFSDTKISVVDFKIIRFNQMNTTRLNNERQIINN